MDATCRLHCFRIIIAAFALSAATSSHAVVYKWVEEDDKVIYSNEPPADPSKVRELTRIDDMALVPGAQRPELVPTPLPQEPVTLLPREPAALPREPEPAPRVIPRSTHTSAVQDPCLVSPDPRCHERNKGQYHPYAGYSPPAGPVQAVGASSSAAGGAVGGQVPASQAGAAPVKRGAHALPPGSAPPSAIEWSRSVR